MSTRSIVASLIACTCIGILFASGRPARAHMVPDNAAGQAAKQRFGGDDPGPLGVEFGVEPPARGTTAFSCLIAVRSLLTGERILLEKFPAEPGKAATFRKSSMGLTVEVEVTIATGGSSVTYSTMVTTGTDKPQGMYGGRVTLRN